MGQITLPYLVLSKDDTRIVDPPRRIKLEAGKYAKFARLKLIFFF